ncbi:MAG: hypothetical protein K2G31_05325 [Clostridia bacterium]|nr:hypothetical protein [Clostridia bacterium]
MRNDDFNIWRDLFGYNDMDFDGDVDFVDADLEDEIFDATERVLNPHILSDFDSDEFDDF